MKIKYLLGFFVILSVVAFGCTQTNLGYKAASESKSMEEQESMMGEEGFEMMNGKMMMINEKAKTSIMMEKDAVLNDGTKVMTNGKVMRRDGTTFMLKENESVWMDGTFMKANEMMENENMVKDSKMMNSEYQGKLLAGTASPYIEFNIADYRKALGENKKILLYFYANWCPICKKEQPETFAAFNELKDPNLVGFRVNFKDSDTDEGEETLAKEFGVAYQHTKVIIKNRERIGKYPDSWDKQRYLTELSKI